MYALNTTSGSMYGTMADDLGALREQIRALKAREAEMVKLFHDCGLDVAEGREFRASIKKRTQNSLDTAALRKGMPRIYWEEYLTSTEQVRIEMTRL